VALHPEIETIVASARNGPSPAPGEVAVEDRRRTYHEIAVSLWPEPTEMDEVRDLTLDVGWPMPARLYVPRGDESRGLVVFFHGGSFVVGNLDTHDGLCRRLAADTAMRLLAVDYRLAPEHPFPAAIDDAIGALHFVHAHVSDFADESATVIVMGDSAGATLATVAAASTRESGVSIGAQVLLYPTLGPEVVTSSAHSFGEGYLLDVEHLRYDYSLYLGAHSDHTDPRVSPLMSLDLTGAPPAVIVVAECDPLRDEAVAYAGLLEHFGTPVELLEAQGMVHGFLRLGGIVSDAMAIVDDVAAHLQRFVTTARS